MSGLLDTERYRTLRGQCGLGVFFAWNVIWWIGLSSANPAPENCSDLGECAKSVGASLSFGISMFLAFVVSIPISILVGRTIARYLVEREQGEAERLRVEAERMQALAAEADRQQRAAVATHIAQSARRSQDRSEFITRLGSANDALDVLAAPGADATRNLLHVASELRSLIATHSEAETIVILQEEAVMIQLVSLLSRLKKLGHTLPEAATLLSIVRKAIAAQSKPSP